MRPERLRDGRTLNLVLKVDEPSGNLASLTAKATTARHNGAKDQETVLHKIDGPFFVEIFSGTGRLADTVRTTGVAAYEFDLTPKGGRKNLLKNKVLHEIMELIKNPNCVGVWFGFPCGTFSSARRHDGGPPPLRGHNSKDIWGLPHLVGKELARVRSANKLLQRMHTMMREMMRRRVPFYLENPQPSKLRSHLFTKKWVEHPDSCKVDFDYCQFDTTWKKATSVLAFGNKKFNQSIRFKCKTTYDGGKSICSRTGKHHELLSGFNAGADKGQYKTNKACPYPQPFCDYFKVVLTEPEKPLLTTQQQPETAQEDVPALASNPSISMERPPPEHYLTHLPKHPGCTACNNCKVQRKQCRDQVKARERRRSSIIKLNVTSSDEIEKPDAPRKFGDLITSDSIFTIKRSSTSAARHGDTNALVIRDRGTGWVMAYPSKKKTAEDMKGHVNDFIGSEKVHRWYSDGAPELHAVCRDLGIRHDVCDPHRSV